MIHIQYDKFIDVKRMVADESGIGEEYETHLSALPCHIQPFDDNFGQDLDGSFGKNFLLFCDIADILEGDRVINGSDIYRVVGVASYKFLNEERHMELVIRKFIT